jgi:hypothetical protein
MQTLINLVVVFTLMVQGQVAYQRGDTVRIKSNPNASVVRIVAVASDRVRIDDSGVYVNGERVTWISPDLLAKLTKPWEPEIIPANHYFVAGETRTEVAGRVSVSRYWSLTGANNLEAVRQ